MINYVARKIETDRFKKYFEDVLTEISDKKVLIYGDCDTYKLISEKFDLSKLNVVAITDESFEAVGVFENYKTISPNKIKDEDFDAILIMSENYNFIEEYLEFDLGISAEIPIYNALVECIDGERKYFEHLTHWRFEKNLAKLTKKLKNKRVLLYGAGVFFETLDLYYDLGNLNIIGISDMKFKKTEGKEVQSEFLGYKTFSPDEIKVLKPDYVLVSTQNTIELIEILEKDLKGLGIKILPLVDKSFWQMLKEIWE